MSQRYEDRFCEAVQSWELQLISKVALAFRTDDRDELIGELARKLAALKAHRPPGIRIWKAYLAKFLYNKASNWVRDDRARRKREATFESAQELTRCPSDVHLPAGDANHSDLTLALVAVWGHLDPELRRFWRILLEENGNRIAAGRRLRKHRNTVSLWIKRIQTVLRRHGFDLSRRQLGGF